MFLGRSFICFLAEGEMGSCTEACKCQCDDKKIPQVIIMRNFLKVMFRYLYVSNNQYRVAIKFYCVKKSNSCVLLTLKLNPRILNTLPFYY